MHEDVLDGAECSEYAGCIIRLESHLLIRIVFFRDAPLFLLVGDPPLAEVDWECWTLSARKWVIGGAFGILAICGNRVDCAGR